MQSDNSLLLPGVLAEIAEATDYETAMKIADNYGGTTCYFPSRPGNDCWLVKIVGIKKATEITKALSTTGMDILIPMGPTTSDHQRRMQIHSLVDKGRSNSKIARAVKCHERTVYRIKAKHGLNKDPNQLDLL